jgi:hypothetical protein
MGKSIPHIFLLITNYEVRIESVGMPPQSNDELFIFLVSPSYSKYLNTVLK